MGDGIELFFAQLTVADVFSERRVGIDGIGPLRRSTGRLLGAGTPSRRLRANLPIAGPGALELGRLLQLDRCEPLLHLLCERDGELWGQRGKEREGLLGQCFGISRSGSVEPDAATELGAGTTLDSGICPNSDHTNKCTTGL